MLMLLSFLVLFSAPVLADDLAPEGGGGKGGGGKKAAAARDESGKAAPSMRVMGVSVEPVALAQIWLTAFDMDTDDQADASGYGDPEDDVGLKFKRLRLGLSGDIKKWEYKLTFGTDAPYDGMEQANPDIGVVDAYIGVAPVKGLDIRVGRSKVPFSRDQLMGAGELVFTERGIGSEHIAPDRNLGLSAAYGRSGGKFSLGVFNQGGDLFGDDALGKTFAGRLEWDTGKANTYQTWGDRGEFGLGVGANGFYTLGVATNTWAVGGDAMLRVANLSVLVDGAYSVTEPTSTEIASPEVFAETDRYGITTQASYQVGPVEPAVRFSLFNDSGLGQYMQFLAGGEWHTADDHVRIGAGYELRIEDQPVDNDTARLWAQFKL